MKKPLWALPAVALLAAFGGYFVAMKFMPAADNGDVVGQPRPGFRHADLSGRAVSAADFDGQVLLVNFWASWCKPCVEEMPMLSDLQRRYGDEGFRVVGIAVDDPERAADFAGGMDLAYPVLLGEADTVVTGRRFGNATGMLPYSALVDRDGTIRWVHLGALETRSLDLEVKKLLRSD